MEIKDIKKQLGSEQSLGQSESADEQFAKNLKKQNGENRNNNQSDDIANKEVDINKYEDVEGLTTRKIEFGLWLVEHREGVKRALMIILLLISVLSWGITFYSFGNYFIYGLKEDDLLLRDIATDKVVGHDYILSIGPIDLAYSEINILPVGDGKNDLAVLLSNSNQNFMATFQYCFFKGSDELECENDFIMPNDKKLIMAFSKDLKGQAGLAKFVIDKTNWDRIDKHKFPDIEKVISERLNIAIEDVKFEKVQVGEDEKITSDSYFLTFKAKNKSAYSYWEAPLEIILYQGGSIVGANRYVISEFMFGQEKNVSINWPGINQTINSVVIEPDINIFDDNVYIGIEGGIGAPK